MRTRGFRERNQNGYNWTRQLARSRRPCIGSVICPEPEVRPNRIGIDTGAYFSDRLTCVALDGGRPAFSLCERNVRACVAKPHELCDDAPRPILSPVEMQGSRRRAGSRRRERRETSWPTSAPWRAISRPMPVGAASSRPPSSCSAR